MKPMMGNLETTETIREVSKCFKAAPVCIVSQKVMPHFRGTALRVKIAQCCSECQH